MSTTDTTTFVTVDATGCAPGGMGIVHYQGPNFERAVAAAEERRSIYRDPEAAEVAVYRMELVEGA